MKSIYLVVTPFFPTPNSFRGSFVYDQVRAIRRNSNYEVIVFHPTKRNDLRKFYVYSGEKVYLFKTKQTPSNLFTGFFDKFNCLSFKEAVMENGIDIDRIKYVHSHTMPFGIYGMTLKEINSNIRIMVQHHCRDPYSLLYGRFAGWYPNLKYRLNHSLRIAEETDMHICVSEIIQDNLLKFPRISAREDYTPYINRLKPLKKCRIPKINNSYVLYNGVDLTKFFPFKEKKRDLNYDLHIGCIANFQNLKDQISLIKSIRIILDNNIKPKVSLIGTGSLLDECKKYVLENGLKEYVNFESEVDHSQLRNFYNKLDLFVLPSVYEGFGCVFIEAAACGIPFMVCEGQGAAEYIIEEQKKFWVLKKHCPEDIAKKIIYFFKKRPHQILKKHIDINFLVKDFLDKIKNI